MNEAAEVKLRAERMAGELLATMEKNKGGRPAKTNTRTVSVSDAAPVPRLSDIGITLKPSESWQAEATVPEPVFEEWVEETKRAGEPLTTTALVRKARDEQARRLRVAAAERGKRAELTARVYEVSFQAGND